MTNKMQYETFKQAIKEDFNIELDHFEQRRGILRGQNKNTHKAICVKTAVTSQIKQQWIEEDTYNSIIPISKLEDSLEGALAGTHIYATADNLTFIKEKMISVKSKTPHSFIKVPHTYEKVQSGIVYCGFYKVVDFIELEDNTVQLIWKKEKNPPAFPKISDFSKISELLENLSEDDHIELSRLAETDDGEYGNIPSDENLDESCELAPNAIIWFLGEFYYDLIKNEDRNEIVEWFKKEPKMYALKEHLIDCRIAAMESWQQIFGH